MEHNGILLIDKPAGMTSFSCCAAVRHLLGVKKAGHAGTLDPNATGVLPVMVGRATKVLDYLPIHDKEYTATVRFGAVSDTLDVWGRVESTGRPLPAADEIEAALGGFRGEILQTPPMTSAIKVDGQRLYDLARQGVEIDRTPRPVTVYTLNMLSYEPDTGEMTFSCRCSKGTYIRTICDDLGRALGCGGVMTSLRRTMAAGFPITDCLALEEIRRLAQEGTLPDHILPIERALTPYPPLTVTAAQATRFCNGGALAYERLRQPFTGTVRVYAPDGAFLGLGCPGDNELTVAWLAEINPPNGGAAHD